MLYKKLQHTFRSPGWKILLQEKNKSATSHSQHFYYYLSTDFRTSLVAQTVKRLHTMQETRVRFLGREDPLEKEMATHSSTLAWKIPWMEERGRLQSMGSQRLGHDWAGKQKQIDGESQVTVSHWILSIQYSESELKWICATMKPFLGCLGWVSPSFMFPGALAYSHLHYNT